MTLRHAETLHTPLSVDSDFIDRLKSLVSFAREGLYESIAERHSLSIEDVRLLTAGVRVGDLNAAQVSASDDIRYYDRLSIKLRYRGTKQLTAQNLDEAVEYLRDEFGVCDQLNIVFGHTGAVHLEIDIDDKYESITYDIRASRILADTLQKRVVEMIKESAPAYPILHARSMNGALYIFVAVSVSAAYLIIMFKMQPYLAISKASIIALIGIPFFAAITVVAGPVISQYRKTFPITQFEFGNQKKRRDASKTATGFLVAGIALPIVLKVIGF